MMHALMDERTIIEIISENNLSSDSSTANSADTQITPGAIVCNASGVGVTASGNKVTTIIKNINGLASS